MINVPITKNISFHEEYASSIPYSILFKINQGDYKKEWLVQNIKELDTLCTLYPSNHDLLQKKRLFENCIVLSNMNDFSDIAIKQFDQQFKCLKKVDIVKNERNNYCYPMTWVVSSIALAIIGGYALYAEI